jgi:hypothetical protein
MALLYNAVSPIQKYMERITVTYTPKFGQSTRSYKTFSFFLLQPLGYNYGPC